MRRITLLTILITCLLSASAENGRGIGLVLSGGGAKGIAHIGVIQALEENSIPIDYITGTSMGAVVGGLYAAGYSPDEMMQLLASDMFMNAAAGTIDPKLRYYLTSPQPTPELYSFALGNDSIAKSVPFSLIPPTVMNFAFMEVFAEATRRCDGDFDKLLVPLRTVCSNITSQRAEINRSGRLADAVRSSMSFPIVFCPIAIDDTLRYDGGIFENFPVATMIKEFNPSFMIGVDVHTPDSIAAAPTALNQISNLVMRSQTYDMPAGNSVRIHIDLRKYSLLDFDKAEEIYRKGYERGLEMVDSIRQRVASRRPADEVSRRRKEFKKGFKPLQFADVTCTGGTPKQNDYIRSFFPAEGRTFSLARARDGFYKAISGHRLQDLQANAETLDSTTYRLNLRAFPKPKWSVGLGGYISSSSSSMLYASVGYDAMSRSALNGNLGAWIGRDYLAAHLTASVRFGPNLPYALGLEGVVSKHLYSQTEKMFFQVSEPKFVTDFQAFARAYPVRLACGRHAVASLSVGYGYERTRFAADNGEHINNTLKLAQLTLRYDYNTLDAINFPTDGLEVHASAMGLIGNRIGNNGNRAKNRWIQFRVKAAKYRDFHDHFACGIEGELLASGRKPAGEYEAALAEAPAYTPTPSCFNSFNSSFRAYSFLGAGLTPIWKITSQLQLRGTFHIFAPWQTIESGNDHTAHLGSRLASAEFFSELQAVVKFKFISLCAYGNYRTGSAADRGWHVGISLGVFALAPEFLK